MHAEVHGDGPRKFLGLHGWGGDHATFEPMSRTVPADATLVAVDLPGYGRTPPPSRWTLEAVLDPVLDVVRRLGPDLTVVGSCSGAVLALLAAEREQRYLSRLVLFDPFAYVPWYFRVFLLGAFGRVAYRTTFASPVGRFVTNQALRARRTAESDLTDSFASVDPEIPYRHLALLRDLSGIERFRTLDLPVDLAYGERTFAAVKRSVRRWQDVLPRTTARAIPGAGHLPLVEAPVECARLVFGPSVAPTAAGVDP